MMELRLLLLVGGEGPGFFDSFQVFLTMPRGLFSRVMVIRETCRRYGIHYSSCDLRWVNRRSGHQFQRRDMSCRNMYLVDLHLLGHGVGTIFRCQVL